MVVAHRDGLPVPRDALILLEHEPVFTLGRGADVSNVLFDIDSKEFDVRRVERGGEVTFHGPGQIVGYPVLDLRRHTKDLHWYMRQVEACIIDTLDIYGVHGGRKSKYTGVWVDNTKVAAVGLNASKWISSHGFALNVTTDLDWFSKIVPCGITEVGTGVTSLERLGVCLGELNRVKVQQNIVKSFVKVFEYDKIYLNEID